MKFSIQPKEALSGTSVAFAVLGCSRVTKFGRAGGKLG